MSALAEAGPVRSAEIDHLIERLGEPRTAAALNNLLDNIELISIVVSGLDELARRGDVISDTMAEVITEVRAAGSATGLDVGQTTHQLAAIIPALADAAPAIRRLSDSAIVEPESVEVVGLAGRALVDAFDRAQSSDVRVGLGGMYKATRDPDVQRGLGFLIELARSFGLSLKSPGHRGLAGGGQSNAQSASTATNAHQ